MICLRSFRKVKGREEASLSALMPLVGGDSWLLHSDWIPQLQRAPEPCHLNCVVHGPAAAALLGNLWWSCANLSEPTQTLHFNTRWFAWTFNFEKHGSRTQQSSAWKWLPLALSCRIVRVLRKEWLQHETHFPGIIFLISIYLIRI